MYVCTYVCICVLFVLPLCIHGYIGDAPIIGSAIGNTLYRLIFSYRLSDQYVYEISSRSDIIGRQLQVYW